jgi:DNA modification methylase
MKVEQWPIDGVIPYARNARKIPQKAIDKVAASIGEYQFRQPIVVDVHGVIIAGHVRLLAARQLGLETVPVHVAEELTEAQVKALRLMDNRSHEESSWNLELLSSELLELQHLDISLGLTGFEPYQIDNLLGLALNVSDDQANAIPELLADVTSITGDLWLCAGHRVLCGEATCSEDVSRLLGGSQPRLMEIDPPYGVEYNPKWREQAGLGHQRQRGAIANDDRVDWTAAYQLFTGNVVYLWHAGIHAGETLAGLLAAGFEVRAQIIWAKQHFALSRGDYHWQHEPCWYAVRKGSKSNWCGDRSQSTLWQVANLNSFGGNRDEVATGHGTQKPVELMRRPMLNHTERGDLVYDPFLGSGTTLIAAALLERSCYGLEIDPRYVDVIVRRWEKITGRQARLADDGRTFEQVQAARKLAVTSLGKGNDHGATQI